MVVSGQYFSSVGPRALPTFLEYPHQRIAHYRMTILFKRTRLISGASLGQVLELTVSQRFPPGHYQSW